VLVTAVNPAKTAEPIEIPRFEGRTAWAQGNVYLKGYMALPGEYNAAAMLALATVTVATFDLL